MSLETYKKVRSDLVYRAWLSLAGPGQSVRLHHFAALPKSVWALMATTLRTHEKR